MINQILKENFSDNIASVFIDSQLQNNADEIIAQLDIGKSFVIISDENTYKVLGKKVEASLSKFKTESIILKPGIANDISIQKIRTSIAKHDAVIAVGSGTINDICKYASYLENKPYIIFGTAPSMNGYSSANASITIDGHKKTLKAHLPKAILLDLDILASAPKRLIQSGLGDSICRPTAQADWLLSNLLLRTEYNKAPFEMLKPLEKDLFDNSGQLLKGDKEIIELLASTLVLSGFGMYMCKGSHPASQGEHMIAHTMEMAFKNLTESYHGEQIAVTTIAMSNIIEDKMQSPPHLTQNYSENEILEFYGQQTGKQCLAEYREKILSAEKLDALNQNIENSWDSICKEISKILIGSDTIGNILKKANAPTCPSDIGWKVSDYNNAVKYAKYSRNRFTFLDL